MPDENAQPTNQSASSTTPQPPANPQAAGSSQSPPSQYKPNTPLALALLAAALVVVFGTGIYLMIWHTSPGYTGGGAAATVGALLLLALVLRYPTVITDDSPAEGGEVSTMRIVVLAIITTFCLLMLRTGWNDGKLPSLQDQGNWVWLVTAALGGKALQKFAEVKEKQDEQKKQ